MTKDNFRALLGWAPILVLCFIQQLFQECYEIVYKVFHGGKSPWVDDDEL
jgi:hypothetical protein